MIYVARWLGGAASIEWLVEHPDWWEWVNICSIAHDQAMAIRAREGTGT